MGFTKLWGCRKKNVEVQEEEATNGISKVKLLLT